MQTEEEIIFATSIAMQLACGLSKEEMKQLLTLINQISCSLANLINCK